MICSPGSPRARPGCLVERSGRGRVANQERHPVPYCCSNRSSRLREAGMSSPTPRDRTERGTPGPARPGPGRVRTRAAAARQVALQRRSYAAAVLRALARHQRGRTTAQIQRTCGIRSPRWGCACPLRRCINWPPTSPRGAPSSCPDQRDLIDRLCRGRDVVLRRTLGWSRSGALLSTYRWMRPRLRRRAALGCPPRARDLSGPALAGDGAHHRRDLVADPRPGTPALVAGGDQNSPQTARQSEQVITLSPARRAEP